MGGELRIMKRLRISWVIKILLDILMQHVLDGLVMLEECLQKECKAEDSNDKRNL